jgi:hypothetical protein
MAANPSEVGNPLGSAGAAESHFENLWQKGAFNADGKPDVAQGQLPLSANDTKEVSRETPAAEAAPAAASPQGAEAPEPEGPEYTDLTDYLAKTGVEAESFYKMPVQVKLGGETKAVPLSDVIKSYQQEADYTRKTQSLAEQRRTFESERQVAITTYQQQLSQASALGNLARQQLLGEFQNIDWNKMRMEDPVKWSVMNTDFNQRAAVIDRHIQQINEQAQVAEQQRQQDLASKVLPAEREKLLEARPEWRDDQQFQAAKTQMGEAARKLGFSDAEISQIYDHRYMVVLDLASRYLALQAKSPEAVKRVRTAPQTAQPGSRQTRDPQAVARSQAKERFEKNRRDPQAQADYFSTLLA